MGLLSKDEFNDLFKTLESVRQKHYALSNLTSDQKTALGTAYNTDVAKSGEKVVVNNIQELKNDLTNLSNSPYIAETFSANITLPSVGELLSSSLFSTIETQVNDVSGICANCAFFAAHFATHRSGYRSHNSHRSTNFSTDFGHRSDKTHRSSDFGTHRSGHRNHDSTNFSHRSDNAHRSSNFGTHRGSHRSHNSTNFSHRSSNYSSNFGHNSHRSTNFSSNFAAHRTSYRSHNSSYFTSTSRRSGSR